MAKRIPDEGFKIIFNSSPAPMLILDINAPAYTIVDANEAYLLETHAKREDIIGKPLFSMFPPNKEQPQDYIEEVFASFDTVIRTRRPHVLRNYRYDIPLADTACFEERYWTTSNSPILNENGEITFIIHAPQDVTSEMLVKQQLQEAEARARLAVAVVGMGTFDLDLPSGEIHTSQRFAEIFGFDEPVSRAEYAALIDPSSKAEREQAHIDSVTSGRLYYEAKILRKDGTVRWVKVEGKVIYSPEGEPVRVLGTLLDSTEERKALEEQKKLITLVDNSVDLMSILNLEGTNSYINKAGKEMLGFASDEEVLRTPISELHLPEDFDFVQREVIPSVMQHGHWSGEMRVKHLKSGEVFPVSNNCIRIDDPISGDPIAVGAVMRDLRPELAAKKALADSEELLRHITNASPTALWMSDENGKLVYTNQTWLDWTGHQAGDKDNWLDAVVPEDQERALGVSSEAFERRTFYEVDFRIRHTDGTIRWCVGNGKPQFRADGSFSGYIGACIDLTDQKNLQQQKDDFLGIASHELKTPVTSIKAYAQVLEKMLARKGDEKEASMIRRMDAQINRLTALISDLLDVTKINSGKLQFNDREFDFVDMVKEMIEDLQRTTESHTLVENYGPSAIVFGDRERIGQVIANLITNAVKYSPGTDTIEITSSIHDDEVRLAVRDFGIGIPQDKIQHVFEQFYRVSGNMQHTFPGLGLGLYISSEIIKREGGRIWVYSTEGEGSTFCFALPIIRKDA